MTKEKYIRYKDKEKRKAYNRLYQRQYMRKYRQKLKEAGIKIKWNSCHYLKDTRLRALDKLGGRKCVNCGCMVEEILEINHKGGKGRKERKKSKKGAMQFYRDIVHERVDISKYNVLCRVCNAQHYVEKILRIKGHKISWNKPL